MTCKNCGAPLESDAKFCTNCGSPAEETTVNESIQASVEQTSEGVNQPNYHESDNQSENKATDSVKQTLSNIQENEYVEKGKVYAVNYFEFAKQALKAPFKTAKKMQSPDIQLHGMTTIGLYSLLMPLLFFFMLQTFNEYLDIPFFDVVVKPFAIIAIASLVMAGVLFGVGRLMKVNVSYKAVLGAYGSLHALPVALLLLAMILLIFNNYGLISLVLMFMFLVATTINVSVLFALKGQLKNEVGLDVVYGIILSYIALIILVLIIGDSVMGSMMMDIESLFYGLF